MTRRAWAQLGAYVLVVATFAFALWRIDEVRQHDEARSCVSSWERSDQIRNMGEVLYRRNAETLISLAAKARPKLVATYRAQVERDVAEIRSKLHNPSCDLDAAKRRLNE